MIMNRRLLILKRLLDISVKTKLKCTSLVYTGPQDGLIKYEECLKKPSQKLRFNSL